MNTIRRFYLRLRYDPLLTFVLGALAAGIIQIVSGNALKQYGALGLLAVLVTVALAFLLYRAILWLIHKLLPPPRYPIGDAPDARKGLIMVLGGSSRETGPEAITHHLPRLEHVWFVVTDRTIPLVDNLKKTAHPALTHQEDVVNYWEPPECNNAVQRAISHARVLGIDVHDLICDVTGGTTAMTAGAIEACLTQDVAAQMVAARYDDALKAVTPIAVIELDLHSDQASGKSAAIFSGN